MTGIPPKTAHLGLFRPEPGMEDWAPWLDLNWVMLDVAINALNTQVARVQAENVRLRARVTELEDAMTPEPLDPQP